MKQLVRVIQSFKKGSDELAREIQLKGVRTPQLRKLFGVAANDPMIEVFEITGTHAPALAVLAGMRLDLKKYDYFLDCYAANAFLPRIKKRRNGVKAPRPLVVAAQTGSGSV